MAQSADAAHSKCAARKGVWVRVPLRALSHPLGTVRRVHTEAEFSRVRTLRRLGRTYDQIAAATGLGRSTVARWLTAPPAWVGGPPACLRDAIHDDEDRRRAYAYLLGLYLGDGHLVRMANGVYKLEVFQDAQYVALIEECRAAMSLVARRRVNARRRPGSVAVYAHSKHWPCVFPQHGPGRKHERVIVLEPWQQAITDAHPKELLRGLIHSDGCRVRNRVQGGVYDYPRYFFSNRSADIHAIFRRACDLLGIAWRQNDAHTTNIARRADVAFVDTFVGPKS